MAEAEPLIEAIEAELHDAVPSLSSIYIRPERQEDAPALPPVPDGDDAIGSRA
jgi:hypothetical protein